MATSPRASAPTASSAGGWTILRPFGARAIATSGATQGTDALFIQTFRLEDGGRSGDPVRDLRALLNLRHANVGRIKEVSEKEGAVTVVSPYVEGETLAALREGAPIPLGIQLRILVDVLTGITAIHGLKDSRLKPLLIVHGEIAPANVVVGFDGVPKLIQLCGVHAQPGAQGADTLGYLAPEILLADDAFDQRVDIYAVGVMLWEALSGTTLFPETNAGAIVTRHLSGRIRKATVPEDTPWAEPLIDVAQKAISTDPNGRYATAGELSNEIKRIAKTNLAATVKVSALVKERGADAIARRRTALGLAPSPLNRSTLIAPMPIDRAAPVQAAPVQAAPAPNPAVALKPVPTPVDAAPTTKPVVSAALIAASAEVSQPGIQPKFLFPPPEPAGGDRVTLKTPVPTGIDDKAEDNTSDFSDLQLESEPPPPPPVYETSPGFAPTGPRAEVSPPMNLAPVPAPMFMAEPAATPALGEPLEGLPDDDASRGKRRGMMILFGVGAVALLVILLSLRSCLKTGPVEEARKKPAPVETTPKVVEPVATAEPEPTATTATTATTAKPAETVAPVDTTPPVAKTADPPVAKTADPPIAKTADPPIAKTTDSPVAKTAPTYTAPPPATGGKPAPTSTKPKKTYDPLGI